MISPRYATTLCLVAGLALVPTLIHSYAGVVVADARTTTAIPERLAGYASVPSGRDAGWGARRFESFDWLERRYVSGQDEVALTVLRSYDLKKLYHHPELDVAYGAGYLESSTIRLRSHPTVPVHVLRTSADGGALAMYALHYGDGFVDDPLWFQVRVAGELLFRGRRAMTLLFARQVGEVRGELDATPAARVLTSAIEQFAGPAPSAR